MIPIETNRLEIQRYLAPYLPYNLKMGVKDFVEYDVLGLIPADGDIKIATNIEGISGVSFLGINQYSLRPYLRPLSHLTKEITHNGETFVPIVRINEILGIRHQLTRYEVDGEIYYGWNEQGPEDSQGYAFGYYKDGKFGIWWDYPDEDAPFNEFTSLSAIKKLYEWHFDLEGLLDAGLALPIND